MSGCQLSTAIQAYANILRSEDKLISSSSDRCHMGKPLVYILGPQLPVVLVLASLFIQSTGIMASALQHESKGMITVLGFGSLLSERSSRTTFPDLVNFRLGRVRNYRRVFSHPASIFFQRGIANMETKEICSLSVEYDEGNEGFICSVFEVPNNIMLDDGVPSAEFLEREEEFNIINVPFEDFQQTRPVSMGVICTAGTDELYLERWGHSRFEECYRKYGIKTIWGWRRDSGIRPCAVYLRHCYLAAQSMGAACLDSFLDETFLIDRSTSVRKYLEKNGDVLSSRPPPSLEGRYSG